MKKSIETPIGRLELIETDGYLTGIKEADGDFSDNSPLLDKATEEIREYFSGKRKTFSIPLSFSGSAFEEAVWDQLQLIPYGERKTYKDIAEAIGRPGSCRAVGNAVGKNPIAIMIPCHRIIRNDGKIGGFSLFGPGAKKFLLSLEDQNSQL